MPTLPTRDSGKAQIQGSPAKRANQGTQIAGYYRLDAAAASDAPHCGARRMARAPPRRLRLGHAVAGVVAGTPYCTAGQYSFVRPRQLKEYGEKVLVEIYQSMLTHGVVPIPVPAGGQAVTAVGGHNYPAAQGCLISRTNKSVPL
uniref:Uncharacterized protein n=1 Tax=Oryza sativa subsp. japonica TaxID=39947 RepID=Q6H6I2_ORYSJ|nr:hypothetical protein [Oryza sativa Japonica Group]BAD25667.1 hypothetical protein [Oryza sativa Japonica Group]